MLLSRRKLFPLGSAQPPPDSPGGISSHPRQQKKQKPDGDAAHQAPRLSDPHPERGRESRPGGGRRAVPGWHPEGTGWTCPSRRSQQFSTRERVRPRAVREGLARGAGSTSLAESPLAEAQGGSECDAPPAGGFSPRAWVWGEPEAEGQPRLGPRAGVRALGQGIRGRADGLPTPGLCLLPATWAPDLGGMLLSEETVSNYFLFIVTFHAGEVLTER